MTTSKNTDQDSLKPYNSLQPPFVVRLNLGTPGLMEKEAMYLHCQISSYSRPYMYDLFVRICSKQDSHLFLMI